MHKTERWVLFPYLAMDYKAAEDWLNQQARAGWRVASFDLRGWTVYLLPADRPDIRYCVDLSGEKARNQESYLALCHEAGWGLVETVRSMNVFCTLPGADPAPIQTDPGLERDRFERIYFWKSWLLLLFMLLFPPLLLSLLWLLLEGATLPSGTAFPSSSSPARRASSPRCSAPWSRRWCSGSSAPCCAISSAAGPPSAQAARCPSPAPARPACGEQVSFCCSSPMYCCWSSGWWTCPLPATPSPISRKSGTVCAPGRSSWRRMWAASRRSAGEAGGDRLPFCSISAIWTTPVRASRPTPISPAWNPWHAGRPLALRRTSELPLAPVELGFDESWSYTGEDGFHILLLSPGQDGVTALRRRGLDRPRAAGGPADAADVNMSGPSGRNAHSGVY
ncbi:MAG: DUF2812 domain-containing protein [Intestinimonas sp.]